MLKGSLIYPGTPSPILYPDIKEDIILALPRTSPKKTRHVRGEHVETKETLSAFFLNAKQQNIKIGFIVCISM